ncbi:MAG: NUDIX domain-containing protein [Polaromonas sp.]|uniref:NUDIX hydrolase n=1 Tax=Polaromonas sp. TaxID=1869339 RepID=UPI0027348F44|nr:NUDIX domain-containing protein [Polaromonas sp.]MDP2819334.1 NUDIX domain-containing protein [Polaromonas sp.]
MTHEFKFCPNCASPLALVSQMEDGGEKVRLRCPACDYTHWNNPVPVLAAVIEYQGKILLARNAAWTAKMYALITGFMEAGETPEGGITREIREETHLDVTDLQLIGVYDFQRMNQIIIAYSVVGHGEVKLSPELVDYKLYAHEDVKCWPAGTGYAMADFLKSKGYTPQFVEWSKRD